MFPLNKNPRTEYGCALFLLLLKIIMPRRSSCENSSKKINHVFEGQPVIDLYTVIISARFMLAKEVIRGLYAVG